jgi:hypothetical protein
MKSAVKLCRCRFKNRHQKTVSLPIHKSAAKNFATVDSKISNKTTSLSIQKSTAWNCAAANPKISNKTLPQSILKSIAKYCVVVDLEINSQKLCCYRFWNQQPPSNVLLPIQKSATKTMSLLTRSKDWSLIPSVGVSK